MADKCVIYKKSQSKFYGNLDCVIAKNRQQKRKIVMFGCGIPANMAIYYLRYHHVEVDAIIDNNKSVSGTVKYGVGVYTPEEYLKNHDETILVMIASSYEDAMIKQLEGYGYSVGKEIIKLLDFEDALEDYSFVSRENFRLLEKQEFRKHQLRVLDYLKSVCEAYNLRYWLCGGTLLGAVRHQGYIPWDDDIDIAMEIHDLKKLVTLLKEEKDWGIASFLDEDSNFYCHGCSYLYETASAQDVNYFPLQASLGISIDIFPVVGLPDNLQQRKSYIERTNNVHEEIIGLSYSAEKKRIAMNRLISLLELYEFDHYNSCARLCSQKRLHYIYSRSDYACTKLLFEGKHYNAPAGWDFMLHSFYGDYMVLPPESDRVQHKFRAYTK